MPLDEPIQTRLSWTTSFDQDLWSRASALLDGGPRVAETATSVPVEVIELGPGVPDERERRVASLTLMRDRGAADLRWILYLSTAPFEPPPDDVLASNQRFGGQTGLMALAAEGLGVVPVSARMRSSARLPATTWRCTLMGDATSDFESPVRRLGERVHREQVGYRFEDGPSGLQEVAVIYDHIRLFYILTVEARLAMRPSAQAWPGEDVLLIELMAATMFKREGAT